MIIVSLIGGLGNQMFQYAFGYSLASDLNTELFFDLSHYESNYSKSLRHEFYNLDHFKIKNIDLESSDELKSSVNQHYTEHEFNQITGFPSRNIHKLETPAYFDGFWQSELYFGDHEDDIRKEFQFNTPLKGKDKEISRDISNHNSIALHIRRGDYLNYTKFGTCSKEYYEKSVKFMSKNVENPKFYIFSDDHQWVKENIHIPHPNYHVTHNDVENGHNDLHLMSLCQHFIIANSSFSWWGAWLSKNDDKLITTPTPWILCREPNLRYIDHGKHFFPIRNDQSKIFDNSSQVLFQLKASEYSSDISIVQNTALKVENNMLNIKTSENKSKLYLKETKRLDEDNDVLMKISLQAKADGILKLYYKTKQTEEYGENNSFYLYYYENEDLDTYVLLSNQILLKDLLLVPSTTESEINLKSLEIREINNLSTNSKKSSLRFKAISTLRKYL